MGGTHALKCFSCGYAVHSVPGDRCFQKAWHQIPKLSTLALKQAKYWARERTVQQMGAVPGWVRARIAVESLKQGKSPNQLAGEIMTRWAKKHL